MPDYVDVPAEILARLRSVCLELPDAYEEQAWAGTRWRIRGRTFAHVFTVNAELPPPLRPNRAVTGPVTRLTFRSTGFEFDALCAMGYPFYRPDWGTNVLGMVLDADTDWGQAEELLIESYCVFAPKTLLALVKRPTR